MKSKLEIKIFELSQEKKTLRYQLDNWKHFTSSDQIKVWRRRLVHVNMKLREFNALLDMRVKHAPAVTALVKTLNVGRKR